MSRIIREMTHSEIWLLANPDPARRAHGRMVEDDEVLTLSRPK